MNGSQMSVIRQLISNNVESNGFQLGIRKLFAVASENIPAIVHRDRTETKIVWRKNVSPPLSFGLNFSRRLYGVLYCWIYQHFQLSAAEPEANHKI